MVHRPLCRGHGWRSAAILLTSVQRKIRVQATGGGSACSHNIGRSVLGASAAPRGHGLPLRCSSHLPDPLLWPPIGATSVSRTAGSAALLRGTASSVSWEVFLQHLSDS